MVGTNTYPSRPVAFKVPNGQYLVAENGGGGPLLANRPHIKSWETFRLITLENGKVALQAPLKEEYLSVLPDGNFGWVGHLKEWEMLDLVQILDNKVALKGFHGKYISIQQGGGGTVIANGPAIKEWEILELIELESKPSNQKEEKGKDQKEEKDKETKSEISKAVGTNTYPSRPVAFKVPNGQYLVAENGGGGPLLANRPHIKSWETFRLITLENGKVALQAPIKEEYLSVLPDGNFGWVGHLKEWEMLDLVQLKDNKVALKGFHGKYISIQQGGGGTVIANGPAIKEWEILELVELESKPFNQKEEEGKDQREEKGKDQKEEKDKETKSKADRGKKANIIILEFDRQKKDDIRDFTEGSGRLFKKVAKTIAQLQKSGEIDDGAQPVIAIVKQKKSSRKKLWDY